MIEPRQRARAAALGLALGASWLGSAPAGLAAQIQPTADARLVSFLTEPRVPELGQTYDFMVTVRVAPGLVAFMPDTLVPTPNSFSAGDGTWATTPGPADSVDVRATYPVMSLVAGGVYTPAIEIFTRPPTGGEPAGIRRGSEAPGGLDRILLPTGAIQIINHAGISAAEDGERGPRPPADVVGGDWSPWLVAGVALGVLAAAAAALMLLGHFRSRGAGVPLLTESPRVAALRELDRIRAQAWHTDGRVVDFYDASTGVLRRFAGHEGPDWSVALTSSELMGRLGDRWGVERTGELESAVWVAERVKFGSYRPGAEDAVQDWSTIRGWIEGMRED